MSVTTRAAVRGMAFEIDDLVRARTWAEREGLVLRIRLDPSLIHISEPTRPY